MITNIRLLQLRATGLACEKLVIHGSATHLETEYATLFQVINDLDFEATDCGVDEEGFEALLLLGNK